MRILIKTGTIFIIVNLLINGVCLAQTPKPPEKSASSVGSFKDFGSSNEPTYIKSDQLTLFSKERKFKYSGNVQMKNGDLTVFSDWTDGSYDENNKINDLVCNKNVLITKGEKIRATGGKATYVASNATIVLTENPEMVQDGSVLSADKVTIYLDEDRSIAEGQVRVKVAKAAEEQGRANSASRRVTEKR